MAEYLMDPVPANPYTIGVTFEWGAGGNAHTYRYCRWSSDVPNTAYDPPVTYTAITKIDVELGKQHGGIEDVPINITMPVNLPPCDTLCREYAHAPVAVTVEEFDPRVPSRIPVGLFKGRVAKAIKNPRQAKGLCTLEVSGWRSLLQYPLGMTCKRRCVWVFGDRNCCVDLPAIQQLANIATIPEKTKITAPTLTLPRPHYWIWGSVEYDGLVIDIIDGTPAAGLRLKRPPPPEWAGQPALFTPGCGKELIHCREWNNELRHGGFGLALPVYNPLFGNPGDGVEV